MMEQGRPPEQNDKHSDTTQVGTGKQALRLRVQLGSDVGRTYTMSGDRLTIGRASDNDLVIDDPQASRYHARLVREGSSTIVEDLGSTNGTLVNGRRITTRHVLQPTETIAVGGTVFSVEGFSAPITVSIPPVAPAGPGPKAEKPSPGAARPKRSRRMPWLAVGGVAAVLILVLLLFALGYFLSQQDTPVATTVPSVFVQSPVTGSLVQINDTVEVAGIASDSNGITRVDLWVGGRLVDQQVSSEPGGEQALPVNLSWTPSVAGVYTLELLAYNSQDVASAPTTIMITVSGESAVPPTDTPALPTAVLTPGSTVLGVTTADLNVREGPGQVYPVIDLLPVATQIEISGRNPDSSWWQIAFPRNSDGHGWVYAPFTRVSDASGIPVVPTPIPPTTTLTPTPEPTTTSTSTPAPTNTPLPAASETFTPSPTSPTQVVVEFWADEDNILPGECAVLEWHIENVMAAFLQGGEFGSVGVTGPTGSAEACPSGTTLYVLRAETASGIVERTVTIVVTTEKAITLAATGGAVNQEGQVLASPIVGDDADNQALRAFLAFDLGELVGARILDARLNLGDYSLVGYPFGEMGNLYIEEVNWTAPLDSADFSAAASAELKVLNVSGGVTDTSIDMKERVTLHVNHGETRFPIRMRFALQTNSNNADDYVDWNAATLVVRYLKR